MFLMYVDESGDIGLQNSPTRYFVLTGLVVHELRWAEHLEKLLAFRRRMRTAFNLPLRDEIHSAHLINKPGPLVFIKRNDRLSIIRFFAKEIGSLGDLGIINVVVDKHGKAADYDVCASAWRALIQRFSITMRYRVFRSIPRSRALSCCCTG